MAPGYVRHVQYLLPPHPAHHTFAPDSAYMWGASHTPWITCWIALDDVSEENGTLFLLPHASEHAVGSLAAVSPHDLATDGTNDLVGQVGGAAGQPLVLRAG